METSSVSRLKCRRSPARRDSKIIIRYRDPEEGIKRVRHNPDFDRIARDALRDMIGFLVKQVLGREELYCLEIKDPRSNFSNGWATLRGQKVDLRGRCASTSMDLPDSEVINSDPYFGQLRHDPGAYDAMRLEAIHRIIEPRRLSDFPRPQRESASPFFAMSMTEDHGQYPFNYILGLIEPLTGTDLERKFLSKFGNNQPVSDASHILWMPGDGWSRSSIYAKPFRGGEKLNVIEVPKLKGKIPSLERLLAEINRKIQRATGGKGWRALGLR